MNENEIWELLNRPVKDALRDDAEFKQFVDELRNAELSLIVTNYLHRFVSESIDNLQKSQSVSYSLDDDDENWLMSLQNSLDK